jgi:hypothetical protein
MLRRLRQGRATPVGIGALVGGALLLFAASCAPLPPQVNAVATAVPAIATAAPPVAADWNAFTEPTLGYTIRYPQDVLMTTGVSQAGVHTTRLQFRMPGVDGYQGMLIRAEPNPTGRGLEEIVAALYDDYLMGEPPDNLLASLPEQTVAGLPAAQLGTDSDFSIVLPIGDYTYIIAPVHDLCATDIDTAALDLFYQVLATLEVAQ